MAVSGLIALDLPWPQSPPLNVRPAQKWLDRGLIYASTVADAIDAVTGKVGTRTGTRKVGDYRAFGATYGVGTTDGLLTSRLIPAGPITLAVRVLRTGGGGGNFGRVYEAGTPDSLYFDQASSRWQFGRNYSTTAGAWTYAGGVATGSSYWIVITHDGTLSAPTFYLDGATISGTVFVTPSGTQTASAAAATIGNRSGGTRNFDGFIGPFLLFDQVLSPQDVREIAATGAVWEPLRILVPVSAGGGGTTISVPAGSLALTGFAPIVSATANQTIAVPAGALTLAGFAPTVNVGANQTISVPAGSLTITGFAPTVNVGVNQNIAVPAGSLSLTGFAPTISTSANQPIAVPVGSLTLTGFAPTVVQTAHQTISVPLGTLVMAGYAPTVSASGSYTISVPLGALVLTGYAPVVNNSGASATVTVKLGSWIRYKILT